MWTTYINVSVQVARVDLTKSEIEDIIFGLKLADSAPDLVEKLEALNGQLSVTQASRLS